MEAERLSKERELRKMTTKREKEVAEHKKQLTSIKQELEEEKQKSYLVQQVTINACVLLQHIICSHVASCDLMLNTYPI